MKKLLIISGTVLLVVILLVAVIVGVAAVRGSSFDKESKAYVDRNLPLIISKWNEQELWSQASPEFRKNTKKEDLARVFAGMSSKFGKMQSYEGSEGQSYVDDTGLSSHNEKLVTAVYDAMVSFSGGRLAVIRISLIKHGDVWQIEDFNINTDGLIHH
jgi:hypothetical protein